VRDDGAVLGVVRGPGCSPHRLTVEGSLDVLQELVDRLGRRADVAVLLLAALDFPDEEAAYLAAAEQRGLAARTIVGNDTLAVLRAGSDSGWGVAVTCGAGINCVGVAPDGRTVRFPSLGPVSGDWGGGQDVGVAATSAAARSADGRGPKTSLERLVPEHFGLTTPTELAAWTGMTLVEAPEREMRAGDRVVLGAGMGLPLRMIFDVREAVRPQLLSVDVRLPFGITNDETTRISPIGLSECRVTYN